MEKCQLQPTFTFYKVIVLFTLIFVVTSKPATNEKSEMGSEDSGIQYFHSESANELNFKFSNRQPRPIDAPLQRVAKDVKKTTTIVKQPRRLKVPSKVFRLLSEYEQKVTGIKETTSSIVGMMKHRSEDEEEQSRRLKVPTTIYNWLVANQNKLENINELPPNFPSIENDLNEAENNSPTEVPTNYLRDPNFRKTYPCPIGNRNCQVLHSGL